MKKNTVKALLIVIGMLAAGMCYAGSRMKQEDGLSLEKTVQLPENADIPESGADDSRTESSGGQAGSKAGGIQPGAGGDGLRADNGIGGALAAGSDRSQAASGDAGGAVLCYVYICGEVVNPGVYPMPEGGRVFQAVELAGGFTDAAAAEYLNMADVVQDGMKLVVPAASELAKDKKYGESAGVQTGRADGSVSRAKVNINTAGKEELKTLTGIGEAKAEDIIRYRTEKGPFQRIEDVMKISGIKDAAFQKIRNDITV